MRILAVIPARGGSKRLPGKNVRPLGGKPLIAWSIAVARGWPQICDVLVSTDSEQIAAVARAAGAYVPWLRPAEFATDVASSVDVCLHALDWYERESGPVDGLLLLQPTSPFRTRDTVRRGIEMFQASGHRCVLGVAPAQSHPYWCFRLEGGRLRPFMDNGGLEMRSQDLPPAVVVNGAFYLVPPHHLRANRSFYSDDMAPLVMEQPAHSIDIDTEWDWRLAEAALAAHDVRAE